jgi:hypothetical protein
MKKILNKKSFWQEVLDRYLQSDAVFICFSSPTFEHMWRNYTKEIQDLGHQFIKMRRIKKFHLDIHNSALFIRVCEDIDNHEKFRKISRKLRINFLKYMIEKCEL